MYLDYDETYWAVDIEADSLAPTVVYCMGYENIVTKEKGILTDANEIFNFFADRVGHRYVGHNLLKFDAPNLNRLVGTKLVINSCIDTLVLSTLYHPGLEGGHSLDAWGVRIRMPKGVFNDWSKLSKEMMDYCQQDVAVTAELYRRLVKVMRKIGFSEKTCYIQHHFTAILERQRKNGFYFDGQRAMVFYQQLRKREDELTELIHAAFKPERVLVRERPRVLRNGQLAAQYVKDSQRYVIEEFGDTYRAYEDRPFNIGSPLQRVAKLTAMGWEPDEFTPTGLPKPTEKSLAEFAESSGIPEAALLTKWLSINGRGNMVNNWLENWNEQDSCMHGDLFVANTLRLRHSNPNSGNIPGVRTYKDSDGVEHVLYGEAGYFTYEARDLWTARPRRVLVGTDAAGLELRMLAHYLKRPSFNEQVLSGDPHQYNADLAGVSRPRAKTLLYAIQYGAQANKVASIIKGTKKEGAALREQFLERLGLKGVMDEAIREQVAGRVWLVDGAGLVCPSPHSALNYKLQGGGARVMAQAAIFLERYIRSDGLDSLKVGDIHDEWQYDVDPRDSRRHAERSVQSIREAGEELNLTIPLGGTAKEGLTWAQTH